LAEQWQRELADKFHIQAELVLSGTVRRLVAIHEVRRKNIFEARILE
jgi:hypothetical protein